MSILIFLPIVTEELLYSNKIEDVYKLTYEELRISDFILPLFVRKSISKYIGLGNNKSNRDYLFKIQTTDCNDNQILLKPLFDKNGSYQFTIINIDSNVFLSRNDNVVVSIDLDYFYSNAL